MKILIAISLLCFIFLYVVALYHALTDDVVHFMSDEDFDEFFDKRKKR